MSMGGVKASASGSAGAVMAAATSSPVKSLPKRTRKSKGKKGKQREEVVEASEEEQNDEQDEGGEALQLAQEDTETQATTTDWPFLRLSEPAGSSSSLPAVFSRDGRFCFVATGSAVKIYSISTCQLLSTLSLPPLAAGKGSSNTITGLFLHPSNSLQLLTTSLDGQIRLWDYLDGRVLRSIDAGGPITLAAVPSPQVGAHLQETIFAGVLRCAQQGKGNSTIIYSISLKRTASSASNAAPADSAASTSSASKKMVRLGKCQGAFAMQVSNDGRHVVILGKRKIHIAVLASSGSGVKEHDYISFEGYPAPHEAPHSANDSFTSLAIHPTESYFATGDSKGVIRFWHVLSPNVLAQLAAGASKAAGGNGQSRSIINALPRQATSTVHWHAHAVAALHFTPNGAYLISGGEEAVLVVWQLESRHKEFVPRLGERILSVGIAQGAGREQEFVVRLADGTISFVGAGTLKVVRSISGVKSVADSQYRKSSSNVPLAVEPVTSHLVFPAAHPSSIQFFSPSLQSHVHELEISPSSNRVSRADDRAIEPVRVERVAFSGSSEDAPEHDGRVFMASFDTWQDRTYARENHLKFWVGYPGAGNTVEGRYTLLTRVDQPHGFSRLSSLIFAPSGSSSTDAKCATTSLEDGSIKVWSYFVPPIAPSGAAGTGYFHCLYSFNYRSLSALDAAFSPDGSLLAIAHPGCISLWNASSGKLIRALTAQSVGQEVKKVAFLGKEGTRIVAAGKSGSVVWDVLTCEEILSLPLPGEHLVSYPSSSPSSFTVTSGKSASTVLLPDGASPAAPALSASRLAYPSKQLAHYPRTGDSAEEQTLALMSGRGDVYLTGPGASSIRASGEDATNLRALARTGQSADAFGGRPLRLFDEIFGASEGELGSLDGDEARAPISLPSRGKGSLGGDVFELTPCHRLPPVGGLWKDLLGQALRPLSSAVAGSSASPSVKQESQQASSQVIEDSLGNGDASMMDVDDALSAPPATSTSYVDSPASLVDIFRQSLSLQKMAMEASAGTSAGNTAQSQLGHKDARMAGSDRKTSGGQHQGGLKKKKSLSSLFGKPAGRQ